MFLASLVAAALIVAASPVYPRGYTGARSNQDARMFFTDDSSAPYGEVLTFTSALQASNFFGASGSAVPA
jgi:hypothetical protein